VLLDFGQAALLQKEWRMKFLNRYITASVGLLYSLGKVALQPE
jgi:hypothetical protein